MTAPASIVPESVGVAATTFDRLDAIAYMDEAALVSIERMRAW